MTTDVEQIRETAEALLEEAGVPKKNEAKVRDSMLQPCSNCDGQGEIEHTDWQAWRKLHKRDWREALSGDDVPECPEWAACVLCDGTGMRPVDNALPFIELIEWTLKKRGAL
jgi:DnaJ-class molecular chaperone